MSIKLTDGKNWSADLSGTGSLLDNAKLALTGFNIAKNWNSPVNKIEPKDLGPGTLSFAGSTPLPFAGTTLTVSASQGASVGGQVAGSLFGSGDPFDQPVDLANKCCLWLQLNGTLTVGAAGSVAGFGIGIQKSSYAQYRFNRIFGPDAAGNFSPLKQAVETLFEEATPPVNLAALLAAPAGAIFEFDCGGSVKVTGSYSLPTLTLPLATTAVPVLKEPLTITADASLGLSGCFEVSGAFIFRVHRLENNVARFHLFKKSGTTLGVNFSASAGVAGDFFGKDFVEMAFKAITPDCKIDLAARDPQLNAQVQEVLEEAVSSYFSVSLNAEASLSSSISHVFALDIDLQVATRSAEMTDRVNGLFHGDWTLARQHNLPCVTNYSDMLEKVTSSHNAFRFHLLNLFSFVSVTDFLNSAKVLQTPDGVVFTDQDTASRIQASADGRIAEPMSLRKVLAQALQTTLVFKTGSAAPALVELSISGKYFDYERNASRDDLNEIGLLCTALDCALTGLRTDATRVGVVRFDASSTFDGKASDACFVGPAPEFAPKSQADYKGYALAAIAGLYDPSDRFHAAAIDAKLWQRLDVAGNPSSMLADSYVQGFLRAHGRFDGNPGNLSQVMWLYSIWYTVTFWSKAMADYAALLQKAKKLAAQLPAGSRQQTPEIQELMRQLSSAMHAAQVRENNFIDARAQFGLAALYLSSGKTAANDVSLTWNGTTKSASNNPALTA
jgi:hypothetical protein